MKIGVIAISWSLLFLIGGGTLLWLLTSLILIPRARQASYAARGSGISRAAGWLMLWRSARFVALSAIAAPLIVIATLSFAQWRIQGSVGHPEQLRAVVEARGLLEIAQESVSQYSVAAWGAALAAIGRIWLVARSSSCSRSWMRALEARRKAEAALLEGVDIGELLKRTEQADPAACKALNARAQQLEQANLDVLRSVETQKVLRFQGDNGQDLEMSVEDLRAVIESAESEARSLEADAQA